MGPDGGINVNQQKAPPIVTTQPDRILRHNISDEELDMLVTGKSDSAREIFLLASGGVLGAVTQGLSTILKYYRTKEGEPNNLGTADFISVIVLFSCLVLAVALFAVSNARAKQTKSLVDRIRARAIEQK